MLGKLLPLVALLALALIAFQMLGKNEEAPPEDDTVPAVRLEEGSADLELSPPMIEGGEEVDGAVD